ncbi:MAG: M48 family metalloprotease [Bacteroidales bacterium]|nr:M48 family metalloprotease [Bacteroidales bacterium]
MKKHILSILFILFSIIAFSQDFDINLYAVATKDYGSFKVGEEAHFVKFTHQTTDDFNGKIIEKFYLHTGDNKRFPVSSELCKSFNFNKSNIQEFWDGKIIYNVVDMLKDQGFQYSLRKDIEDETIEYINILDSYDVIFKDPYLENYLYGLIAKIAPSRIIDGRPGSINIIIQRNEVINAACYPNGTIIINTGMLAALHSEDELVAILAHEIAHFILDHSIKNINKAIQRQKRAEFWVGITTGLTAIAEVGMAAHASANNSYYEPGELTASVAHLSTTVGKKVLDRLGMEYNHEQEKEADEIAREVVKYLGYDPNALSTALSRIHQDYLAERNNVQYFASYTHPALVDRIKENGQPNTNVSHEFEKMVSFAVSDIANMKYNNKRFHQCLQLVSQNIENNVGQVDDYILKANCILATQNSLESNIEALSLINIAKQLNSNNLEIYKSEIIATLRLNKVPEAITLLKELIVRIDSLINNMSNVKGNIWDAYFKYYNSEKRWASQMLTKLNGSL